MADRRVENAFQVPLSRRNLLRLAAAEGLFVAGIASACDTGSERPKVIDVMAGELKADSSVVARLTDFEHQARESLSVEQARKFVPLIADFYISATKSNLNRDQLVNNAFIYSNTGDDLNIDTRTASVAELMSTSVIREIQAAYPDLVIDKGLAVSIVSSTQGTIFSGAKIAYTTPDGKLFLNMDSINHDNPTAYYGGIAEKVKCDGGTLTQHFRSITVHEMVHLEAKLVPESDRVQPSAEFAQAFAMFDPVKEGTVTDAKSGGGFTIDATLNRVVGGPIDIGITGGSPSFEEWVAVYKASKIAADNGLVFTSGALTPAVMVNFERLLSVSGIDMGKFIQLHLSGNLEGFIMALANAAKPLEGEAEKKVVDRKIISDLRESLTFAPPPRFDELEKYYSGVFNKEKYTYTRTLTANKNAENGCLTSAPMPRPSLAAR